MVANKKCFIDNIIYIDWLDMIKLKRSKRPLKMFRISTVNLFVPSESLLHKLKTTSAG